MSDTPLKQYDVVVVGGGLAGVTAARDLAKAGQSVVILEARERLGGRTFYRQLAGTDRKVEVGGTWIDLESYRQTAREIQRYDLPVEHSPTSTHFFSVLNGNRIEAPFPIPFDEWVDFERGIYRLIEASHRIDPRAPLDAQGLDDLDIPMSEYLAGLGLPRATEEYIAIWCGLTSAARMTDVSALFFLTFLAGMGYSALKAVTVLSAKFGAGTISLIDAMVADGEIETRLGCPVASIVCDENSVAIGLDSGDIVAGKAALVAVPMNCWNDISFDPPLSAMKRECASERHAGRGWKTWAKVRNAPFAFTGVNGSGERIDLAVSEYHEDDHDWVVIFTKDGASIDGTSVESVQDGLRDMMPGAEVEAIDYHDWLSDPYSKGTWLASRPGWMSQRMGDLQKREGRVVFAGSDVAAFLPCTIEGAISSGCDAATAVQQLLSESRPL